MSTLKTSRINLRASQAQEEVIKRAAELTHSSVSDFVLSRATAEAEKVLADRRWFLLDEERFNEFVEILDSPFDASRVDNFMEKESVFGRNFSL